VELVQIGGRRMSETLQEQKRASAKRCSSCERPIIWAKTDTGKWMPLDYDPDEGGNVFFFLDFTCKVGRQTDQTPQFATRHFSHFATCPNAKDHRR
jgi:hypothetical protein